jgi:riboflavin kinase / FMN adenylyltransferase
MTQSFVRVDHLVEVDHRQPTYLAIGSFDGVHRGHQAVLQAMGAAARAAGVRAAVLTFFPHPQRLIRHLHGRYYLTTLEERVALLAAQGVDLIITHPFDDGVRHVRAADFVDQLCEALDMRQLWGGNFAFGYRREGDVPFLRRLGAQKGFTVRQVEALVTYADRLVSSSRVRASLEAGDLADANGCLGRLFSVSGTVVQGDRRGRALGFPTANLAVWEDLLLPANGVYATYAWVDGRRHGAATNVGVRPTVNGRDRTVEAHLLDFEGELYGRSLRLEFVARVRPEMKFAGLEALKAQIDADVVAIRALLAQDAAL